MVGLREIYPTISPLTVRKGFSLSYVFARPTLLSTLDNSMLIRLQHVHVWWSILTETCTHEFRLWQGVIFLHRTAGNSHFDYMLCSHW